jgi:hypothetical protein
MICPQCGRQHQNVNGKCPFHTSKPTIIKRQREKPAKIESDGSYYVCQNCHQQIEIRWVRYVHDVGPEITCGCSKREPNARVV